MLCRLRCWIFEGHAYGPGDGFRQALPSRDRIARLWIEDVGPPDDARPTVTEHDGHPTRAVGRAARAVDAGLDAPRDDEARVPRQVHDRRLRVACEPCQQIRPEPFSPFHAPGGRRKDADPNRRERADLVP